MAIDNGNHYEVTNHVGGAGDSHYPSCPHASTCPHCGAPKASPYYPDWTYRPYPYPYYPWAQSPWWWSTTTGTSGTTGTGGYTVIN